MGVLPCEGFSSISVERPENLCPAGMSYRERSMSRPLLFLLFGFLFVISSDPARAEKRVAPVVGITRNQQVPPLGNPSRDPAARGARFRKAGFDVVDDQRDLGIVD